MFLHTHIYLFDFDPDFPHDPYTVQKNSSKGRLELLKILVMRVIFIEFLSKWKI